jgi:hypothetical protein
VVPYIVLRLEHFEAIEEPEEYVEGVWIVFVKVDDVGVCFLQSYQHGTLTGPDGHTLNFPSITLAKKPQRVPRIALCSFHMFPWQVTVQSE